MKVAKAVVAAVGSTAMALTAVLADDVINASEVGTFVAVVVEAAVTVWGVWRVRNAADRTNSAV